MQDKGREEQETDGSWHCGWRGLGEWSMGHGAGVEDCVIQATRIIQSRQDDRS